VLWWVWLCLFTSLFCVKYCFFHTSEGAFWRTNPVLMVDHFVTGSSIYRRFAMSFRAIWWVLWACNPLFRIGRIRWIQHMLCCWTACYLAILAEKTCLSSTSDRSIPSLEPLFPRIVSFPFVFFLGMCKDYVDRRE